MVDIDKHPLFKARIEGDCAYVTLTQGFEAIVDAADVPLLQTCCWHVQMSAHGHAYAVGRHNGKRHFMHRLLLSAERPQSVDHIDGDGLNNRRSNIRLCTHASNMKNKVLQRRNRLGVTGVSLRRGNFCAEIGYNGKSIRLGTYATIEEAAAARRGAAKALYGEFGPE